MKIRLILFFAFFFISVQENFAQNDALLTSKDVVFKRLNYSGLVFRVQVGAYYQLFDDPDEFFGIKGILPYKLDDGIIRYVTTYNYGDIESAELEKEEMVEKGIADAFIVPFFGNKRITQIEALDFLEKSRKLAGVNTNVE
ncbi:MAG: hypothetical protein WD334_00260 [Chitinophagales bacterium]